MFFSDPPHAKMMRLNMQLATHYPPEILDMPTGFEMGEMIQNLVASISAKKGGEGEGEGGDEEDLSFLD